jgi:hypothetical protein
LGKLKGFSGFWYSLENTEKLFKKDFSESFEEFKQATDTICSMSFEEV